MARHPWLTLAAVLGWSGVAIQVQLVLLARWEQQASLLGGLVSVFSYFTILSNTLAATVLSYAAFGREGAAKRFFLDPRVGSGVAASILLVASAYGLLLRHLWQPQGWQWLADELLHDIMPTVFTVYWWTSVPKGTLRLRHLAAWSLYPIVYFAFVLWRGREIGVYPYPFIDVASLGYWQVLLNAAAVLGGFLGIGLVLLGLDHWQGRRLTRMGQA